MAELREELLRAVARQNGPAIVAALSGRSEPERRAVAAEVLKVFRQLDQGAVLTVARDGTIKFEEGWEWEQQSAASLAVLGVAVWSELSRLRDAGAPRDLEHAYAILTDRQPPWLAEWANSILEGETGATYWPLVRRLQHEGPLDERPPGDAFLEAMIGAVGLWGGPRDAATLLREDPELVDELWHLFTLEGRTISLSAADGARDARWNPALVELVATGRLDRNRVLDATLDALARDWSAFRSSWFARFWNALEPTTQERAVRNRKLLGLLGAAAPNVVSFACNECALLAKAGHFAAADLPALRPALAAPTKKTVSSAFTILDRIVKADPSQTAVAVALACEALTHEAADVQAKALDRVERWAPAPDAELQGELLRALDVAAATQRPRLEALVGLAGLTPSGPEAPGGEALRARAAALDPTILVALGGLDGPLPEAPVPGEPVLADNERLEPIATIEELADAVGSLMTMGEWEMPRIEQEWIADGVLQWCACDDAFDGPLRPHLKALGEHVEYGDTLSGLVVAWHTRRQPAIESSGGLFSREAGAWRRRLEAIGRRVAQRDAGGLLALPTHLGGWIEPRVLVQRLVAEPDRRWDDDELALALLRLAPDGRDPAAADAVAGRTGALLRFALGGPPPRRALPVDDRVLLAARMAHDGAPELQVRLRSAVVPAEEAHVAVALTGRPRKARPTGGPVDELLDDLTDSRPRWEPSTTLHDWPRRRDLACAAALPTWPGAPYELWAVPTIEVLRRPSEALSPLALRLLLSGIASGKEEEHLLALDVLADAIDDGRVDADVLAPALHYSLATGTLIANRAGTRLGVLARIGPLHHAVVRDALDTALALAPGAAVPKTPAPLLELFDELCADDDVVVRNPGTRAYLAAFTGSSKATKAAKRLMVRSGAPPEGDAAWRLDARLRRAERWAHSAKTS